MSKEKNNKEKEVKKDNKIKFIFIKIKNKIKTSYKNVSKKMDFTTKKFNAVELILIIIMAITIGIFAGEIIFYKKPIKEIATTQSVSEIENVYNMIMKEYYNKIDSKDLTNAAVKGMMSLLDDKYSYYMDDQATKEFNERLQGEYTGIGIEMILNLETKEVTISKVFEGSAGDKAGLKVNDQIIKINDEEISTDNVDEIIKTIKNQKPKTVNITIKRDDEEITKTLTTGKTQIDSVISEKIEKDNKIIGYIRLNIFAANTDEQFTKALIKLEKQNIDGLIIDVRGNSGGYLETAVNIAELFLDKGTLIYQLQAKDKTIKYEAKKSDKRSYDIVVLIDSGSASASELLTSVLNEQLNATIVGTKSFGKGSVQKTFNLSSGAMIKYTTEKWLTSKGNCIDGKGINPNVEEKLNEEYYKTGKKEDDNQYNKAIEVLLDKLNK